LDVFLNYKTVVGVTRIHAVMNAIMMSEPKTKYFRDQLEYVLSQKDKPSFAYVGKFQNKELPFKEIKEPTEIEEVLYCPENYFYPGNFEEWSTLNSDLEKFNYRFKSGKIPRNCYTVHYWCSSWKKTKDMDTISEEDYLWVKRYYLNLPELPHDS